MDEASKVNKKKDLVRFINTPQCDELAFAPPTKNASIRTLHSIVRWSARGRKKGQSAQVGNPCALGQALLTNGAGGDVKIKTGRWEQQGREIM